MSVWRWVTASSWLLMLGYIAHAKDTGQNVLTSDSLCLTVQRHGAIISDLRLKDSPSNWLLEDYPESAGMYAHYLCFDRWGAVTAKEQERGLFYHGEAAQQTWDRKPEAPNQETLSVTLPVTGLSAERSVTLSEGGSVFAITNHFHNPTASPRRYNAVEHITLSPTGFGPHTRLHSNAQRGLVLHRNRLITDQSFEWPHFELFDQTWDARQGADVKAHSSTSWAFAVEEAWGWVCIENTERGELLGYFWSTSDYPWLIIWSRFQDGQIIARAIEPGTTALSLPHAKLAERQPMLGRPLVNQLSPGGERRHRLFGFLVKLPGKSAGVKNLQIKDDQVIITLAGNRPPLKLSLNGIPVSESPNSSSH